MFVLADAPAPATGPSVSGRAARADDPISAIRAGLAALEAEPSSPEGLGGSAGDDRELGELVGLLERLRAAVMRRVGAWDASGAWLGSGAASPVAALVATGRVGRPEASRLVAAGRLVHDHQQVGTALAAGRITTGHVELLARAARDREELFARDEAMLVEHARHLPVEELGRAVRYWRSCADDDLAAADATAAHAGRYLHTSMLGESVLVEGRLAGDDAAVVLRALDACSTPDPPGTPLEARHSPGQRRADALAAACRVALERGGPSGAPVTALDVVVDLPTLAGARARDLTAGAARIEHVGAVGRDTIRRIGCDTVRRAVLTDGTELLDLGRRSRTVPVGLRRALVHRDRGCVFPGCDRPHRWCDAHHLVHWADGGGTRLDNLALLCRHHHRRVHEGRWTLARGPDGTWAVRPPRSRAGPGRAPDPGSRAGPGRAPDPDPPRGHGPESVRADAADTG